MSVDDRSAPPDVDPTDLGSDDLAEGPAAGLEPALATGRPGKRRRRRRVKRATIVTHRWLSLVLGLVLLVITTSGAAVVYTPEWTAWTNQETFDVHNSTTPISFGAAIAAVDAVHPEFEAGGVNVYRGLYEVSSVDSEAHPGWYGVDPGTGRITGQVFPDRGFMALMNQIHECFFTCDDYAAYIPWLNASVPALGQAWLADLTWGSVILGVTGLLLVFLGLSGIWLWWPGIAKWRHGFRVRWNKNRYARDYDLHQVIGMAAIPFLLVWGLTGASFEFDWVSHGWYAVTGGHAVAEEKPFTSAEVKGKVEDLGMDDASAAAQAVAGSDSVLVAAYAPAVDDATATYSFWFAKGFDAWRKGGYPGDYSVSVDRHDVNRTDVYDISNAPTLSNQLMDNLAGPMFHYGFSVNGWWRLAWFGFGLTPLALAVTGVSTWLFKRGVRKRRQKLDLDRAAAGPVAATASPA